MQPTDHMSTPVEYCRPPSRISGERYQSVTTYMLRQLGFHLRVVRYAHLVGICPERHTKGTGETEICQLKVAVFVNQQVLRLQVTVQNTVSMTVAHALAQLHHEPLDHRCVHNQLLACQ